MRAVVRLFWGVMAGLVLAFGVIVITQLVGAGSNLLGFTVWTFRYYMVCLGVCIALLLCSKPARKRWVFMLLFLVAVVMVMAVGFQTFTDSYNGQDQLAQMQQMFEGMAIFLAKAVMYCAPGALTVFYGVVAFDGLSTAPIRN